MKSIITPFICILIILIYCINCGSEAEDGDDDDSIGHVGTDLSSGLMWQNGLDVGKAKHRWIDAKSYCQKLNCGGYNDWRLPSISELRTLIRGCPKTETDGSCGVTDSCMKVNSSCWDSLCKGCSGFGGPGSIGLYWPAELDGECCFYWSSSEITKYDDAWGVHFSLAAVYSYNAFLEGNVRCVRDAD